MRDRIRRSIRGMNIRRKIILYGYLIFAPIIVLMGLVYCVVSYRGREREYLETCRMHVDSMAENIGLIQKDLWDISTYLCIDNNITALLSSEYNKEFDSNARFWFDSAPMEIVQNMLSIGGNVKSIALYPENGLRPYLRGMDGSVHLQSIEDVRKTDVYRKTLDLQYGTMWESTDRGNSGVFASGAGDKIVLYREMYDLSRSIPLCFMAISIDKARLESVLAGPDYEEGYTAVYDRTGGELCHAGSLDASLQSYVSDPTLFETLSGEDITTLYYLDHVVLLKRFSPNNSVLCMVVPLSLFRRQAVSGAVAAAAGMGFLLVGLFLLLSLVSYIISEPIERLTKAMMKVSEGDLTQRVEVNTQDELGNMAECFNSMVRDVSRLIDEKYVLTIREQESEFAALQAQINPHFLYNMLDSMYWQTLNAGAEDAAESILALSQVFRMVLSNGDRYVPVSHEMLLIQKYLELQKIRFGERLSFDVDYQESVSDILIPKLMVEPFVENSIVHGLSGVDRPCHVGVSCVLTDAKLVFTVKDTGGGMTDDEVRRVLSGEDDDSHRQKMGRYAVKNILARFEIMYPGRYELNIESEKGKGTSVTVIIPADGISEEIRGGIENE